MCGLSLYHFIANICILKISNSSENSRLPTTKDLSVCDTSLTGVKLLTSLLSTSFIHYANAYESHYANAYKSYNYSIIILIIITCSNS